jgi:hypothetical protein
MTTRQKRENEEEEEELRYMLFSYRCQPLCRNTTNLIDLRKQNLISYRCRMFNQLSC